MKSLFNSCRAQRWFVTESSFLKRYAEFWMNNKVLSFPLSLALSHLPFLPFCSFLPLDTEHATSERVQRTRDDVTPPRWEFIIWSPLFNDPRFCFFFFFFRAQRGFERVLGLVSSRFPPHRHRAVTDDVPPPRCVFRGGRLSRMTLVSPTERVRARFTQISYRLAFVTTISGTWTIKNRGYRINNITRDRCGMT